MADILGDLCDVTVGKLSVSKLSLGEGSVPVYGSNGLLGYTESSLTNDPVIITGRVGTLGVVRLIETPAWYTDNVIIIKPHDASLLQYIYYYLQTVDWQHMNRGSTQPLVTQSDIKKLPVVIPDDTDRERAEEMLGSIDAQIDRCRAENVTLERIGEALYREWFIDNPEAETWDDGVVADLVDVYSGYMFKRSEFDASGKYGLVTIKNVQDGNFLTECTDRIATIPPKASEHIRLAAGDILLSLTGNVGRVCVVHGEDLLLNQRVAKLVGKDGRQAFAYFMFRRSEFKDQLISMSRGTAQLNLSPIETKNIKIKVPPARALADFQTIARPLFDKILVNNQQAQTLRALRDILLPRLVAGGEKS